LLVLVALAAVLADEGLAARLDWRPCGDRFECATLAVPVDHAKPRGRQLELALVRLPAADPSRRLGSLVVNPGGPGVSGVDWVRRNHRALSPALRERFDLVGFDPRGVGRSSPVVCRTASERSREALRDPMPQSAAARAALVADARSFARGCARRSGALLPHLTTEATARDLDRLRSALGDRRLTYLGLSYGTVLGTTYANLFPKRVRALVLDGAVDPKVWAGDSAVFLQAQAVGFRRTYLAFLGWCRGHRSRCALAREGDPGKAIERLLARLHRAPVSVVTTSGRRLLTERLAVTGIAAALYARDYWPALGAAGEELSGVGGETLLSFADAYDGRRADGSYTNIHDAYTAISCVDHAPAARDPAVYDRLSTRLRRIGSFLGGAVGYEQLPCAFWPVRAASRFTGPYAAAGAPPILVVGTTGDPATPYSWAKALASRLDSGVLLTRVGYTHVAYGSSECVRRLVDRYLVGLAPPRRGSVCR
jgi:pimeloyl-ACP methyl ester carboxylesterase